MADRSKSSKMRFAPLSLAGPSGSVPSFCPLVPIDHGGKNKDTDLRFSPEFSAIVQRALGELRQQGVPVHINSAYRTAAGQEQMRNGGSGNNPAAKYSDHELGNGLDINGTLLPSFPKIVAALKKAGAQWGGDYRGKKDRPHFYIRPKVANAVNTAWCHAENDPVNPGGPRR